jgi:uncharacterized membrane protein (DUF441 family)
MSFFFIIVGLLVAILGAAGLGQHRGLPSSDMYLALGAMIGGLFFAGIGFATVDIVQAINNQRR